MRDFQSKSWTIKDVIVHYLATANKDGPAKRIPVAIGMHVAVKFGYKAEKSQLPTTTAPAEPSE